MCVCVFWQAEMKESPLPHSSGKHQAAVFAFLCSYSLPAFIVSAAVNVHDTFTDTNVMSQLVGLVTESLQNSMKEAAIALHRIHLYRCICMKKGSSKDLFSIRMLSDGKSSALMPFENLPAFERQMLLASHYKSWYNFQQMRESFLW